MLVEEDRNRIDAVLDVLHSLKVIDLHKDHPYRRPMILHGLSGAKWIPLGVNSDGSLQVEQIAFRVEDDAEE